ncbi:Fic family protein [Schlesneria sp. DSM 10557]|uniref:Fic family protein n=1 Tax=Schlesneria sp. DSM 10557 TaxID=3044399 RepID=UPI0035A079E7
MRRSTALANPTTHVQLIDDPNEVAFLEAQNGLRQFDEVLRLIRESNWRFNLTPELVKDLQWFATKGIWSSAGRFRQHPVSITNTPHSPPPPEDVPQLVYEMCEYANSKIDSPFHVSAYLMWRLNWIHPFGDGNGRTSRAVSYLALSIGLQTELPGSPTVPELIVGAKQPYYAALDAADAAWQRGDVDVSEMESLLNRLLEQQLRSIKR